MDQLMIEKYLHQHNLYGFSTYPEVREALMETEEFREFLRREWLARHPIIARLMEWMI